VDLQPIRHLILEDLKAVDTLISQRLDSKILLVNQLSQHIIGGGGKRIRPILVLLSARALGYEGIHHLTLAAVVEFIHTATLLHDDVVDDSHLRRGHETANAIWGNEASVLVGDYLFSRSFQLMTEVNSLKVMKILADASNTIAKGEVLQLVNCHDPHTTEARYMEVITAKTAKLFSAATQLGAVLCESDPSVETAMILYGQHLGIAFQLIDDALDYDGSAQALGKNIGDDLAEGKPTLPLIYAQQQGTPSQKKLIETAILEGGIDNLESIQEIIASTGAIQYTYQRAKEEAEFALKQLQSIPHNAFYDALVSLAEFVIQRHY